MSVNQWAVGIDLGGTKIELALVDSSGHIHDRIRVPTESKDGYKAILTRIKDSSDQLCGKNKDINVSSIGIGVAGQVNKTSGIVHYAPNLGLHDVKLQENLSALLHKPVFVCNDVKAATWGEWYFGSGKNCNDMVCIFIGTGIGGGVISGGRMLDGCNNTAGEIGHTTILLDGPDCHCGNKGCFEAMAGGWAIARDARALVKADMKAGKLLLSLAGNDINQITAKTVSEAAQKDDALACSLVEKVINSIVAGSSSVINAFGPCRLIFGGGIMEGIPHLLNRIEKGVKKYALKAATQALEILPATLHNDSGVVGAATFAMKSQLHKS